MKGDGDERRASGTSRRKEVGERVGLSPETILRYYREGRIPGRRLPGQIRPVRFLWSEVQAVWDCDQQLELGDAA